MGVIVIMITATRQFARPPNQEGNKDYISVKPCSTDSTSCVESVSVPSWCLFNKPQSANFVFQSSSSANANLRPSFPFTHDDIITWIFFQLPTHSLQRLVCNNRGRLSTEGMLQLEVKPTPPSKPRGCDIDSDYLNWVTSKVMALQFTSGWQSFRLAYWKTLAIRMAQHPLCGDVRFI